MIEDRAVRRLGSTRSEPVDVQIITATSEDLAEATRARRFREELYHRLAVLTLWLPPLRERGGDILLLAERALARACADYELRPKGLSAGARAALLAYRWPGNIRELNNVMERVVLLTEAETVTAEMLGLHGAARTGVPADARAEAPPAANATGPEDHQRARLLDALRATGWNISRAASRLGISRNTLRYRIEKHGLQPDASPASHQDRAGGERPRPSVSAGVLAPEAAEPTIVRWERRRVALLRAVATPSDAEGPPADPSRVLRLLVEKARAFGGRLEGLSPAGIVASFGLDPVEDAPRWAAGAAISILKTGARDRSDGPSPFTVRVAIHVGQFMVGRVGAAVEMDLDSRRETGTVLEELVDRAEPDGIAVSEAAAAFLERRFDLVPLGALTRAPGRAYRLGGRERRGLGVGARMASFAGRRRELELLHGRLAAAASGHGRAVGILGDAGSGKSRLIFEFRQRIAGEPLLVLEGRCLPYASAIPYVPVLDLLRQHCGLGEAEGADASEEKIRVALQAAGMNPDEDAACLLHLLGARDATAPLAPLSAEGIRTKTLETLRQMTLRSSRQSPLVLIVEDLQWMDQSSREYFASVVDSLPSAPILFVASYRPGHQPTWLQKSYATELALEPLSPQESLAVIHSVLEGEALPDSLVPAILARADGNPFFLEELARAVMRPGRPGSALEIPDTIQGVLLTRIGSLPDAARRVLQTAAVLGPEFPARLLEAIWPGPRDLRAPLEELRRLAFLLERRRDEEPALVFKHVLTQEVAYESLDARERRALHAAAGRALEAFHGDGREPVVDLLAYHYARTDEADKAVDYLTRLAARAARTCANAEVVAALTEALVHVERLPAGERDRRRLEIALRQAESLHFMGRFAEILDLLDRQRARIERLDDPALAGHVHFRLGLTHSVLGHHERAMEHAGRALEEGRRGGGAATMGKARWVMAYESQWASRLSEGIAHGRQAVALLEGTDEGWWRGMAHWVLAFNYLPAGEYAAALDAAARTQAVGHAIGDRRLQAFGMLAAARVHTVMGDWEAGIEIGQRALDASPDAVAVSNALGFLGSAHLEKGDPDAAIPLLEQSTQQMSGFRFERGRIRFLVEIGNAHLLRGEVERARDMATKGLDAAREAGYAIGVGLANLALGRIALSRGETANAAGHLDEALRIFASIPVRFDLGKTHLALAELAHAQGDPARAAKHLAEAFPLFRSLGVPRYEARARDLARALGVPFEEEPAG